MSNTKKQTEGIGFDWKAILYVACITFALIIFVSYTVFTLLDFNVTETRDFVTHTYNGHTDTNTYDFKVGREFAFTPVQLFGFCLFSLAFSALSLIHKLSYSKTLKRLLHFAGTVLSFYVFILLMSGTVGDLGFGSAMGVIIAVALVYFILLGIKTLIKRFVPNPKNRFTDFLAKYLLPAFVIFAAAVMLCSILALYFKVYTVINKIGPNYPTDDRIAVVTYETIITPIAPTMQNYLRYLGSAAVFMLGISVLKTKLKPYVKIPLNFIINGCGLVLLWLIQLDIFRELDNVMLYTVIGYVALYIVALITAGVIVFIRKRRKEDEGEYENQFMPGRKSRKNSSEENE